MLKLTAMVGRYFILMHKVFSRPEKWSILYRSIIREMDNLGFNSIGLTAIISFFIGAVVTIQMSINFDGGYIPRSLIGYATREVMILEFSSAVIALILSGKVGSNISSEIGTMRVTEQIDALEIMGINSASYLILPKVIAMTLFMPLLTTLSTLLGLAGGYASTIVTDIMLPAEFIEGLFLEFDSFSVTYSLIKSSVFGFIIASVAGFMGYYARGGSLEVGKASTLAVVGCSVTVMLFNLILTQILLL